MRVLLTNDDGIHAPGLYALYKEIKKIAQVMIVAPETEQSAVGHAITLTMPLKVSEVYKDGKFFGFATTGTPADCVKLAIMTLLKQKPDIIISGINLGPNVGISVLYSGTVCGATEGAILGVPSFAVSLGTFHNPKFTYAAEFARKLAGLIYKNSKNDRLLLNVNIPALPREKIKGVKIAKMGITSFKEKFQKRTDPRKKVYYWLTGNELEKRSEDSDVEAVRKGYVAITPL